MLPDGLPERTLGWDVLQWASDWLVNPDSRGGTKGEQWVFKPDQARFILWFYAVDEEGNWLYRRAYRERAKGTGKAQWWPLSPAQNSWDQPSLAISMRMARLSERSVKRP